MDNCTYNKIKLLHEMSKLVGFIELYGKKDAQSAKHKECHQVLDHLHRDLHEHIKQLHKELSKAKL